MILVHKEQIMEHVIEIIMNYSDWREGLEKRHHKFVHSLIENEYSIQRVAHAFGYSTEDMYHIFQRIEKALQTFVMKKKQEEEKRGFTQLLNSLNEDVRDVFTEVLQKSQKINIYEVYPPKLAEYIENILQTKSVEKTAKKLGVGENYIIQRIKGRNKPRKPCEHGALYYLNHQSA